MSGYITKYVEVPNETTVSFKDRGLKLETASDGEPQSLCEMAVGFLNNKMRLASFTFAVCVRFMPCS